MQSAVLNEYVECVDHPYILSSKVLLSVRAFHRT